MTFSLLLFPATCSACYCGENIHQKLQKKDIGVLSKIVEKLTFRFVKPFSAQNDYFFIQNNSPFSHLDWSQSKKKEYSKQTVNDKMISWICYNTGKRCPIIYLFIYRRSSWHRQFVLGIFFSWTELRLGVEE